MTKSLAHVTQLLCAEPWLVPRSGYSARERVCSCQTEAGLWGTENAVPRAKALPQAPLSSSPFHFLILEAAENCMESLTVTHVKFPEIASALGTPSCPQFPQGLSRMGSARDEQVRAASEGE